VADAISIQVVRSEPSDAPGSDTPGVLDSGAQWWGALFRSSVDTPPPVQTLDAPPGSLRPAGAEGGVAPHQWGGDAPTPSPGTFFSEFSFSPAQSVQVRICKDPCLDPEVDKVV
jgi:hypothetical protein